MTLSLLLLALASATTPAGSAPPEVVTIAASAVPSNEAPSRRDRSLALLEAIRGAAGAGVLTRSDQLTRSASRHAGYLSAHGLRSAPSIHAEAADLAGFTGADPFVRMRAAGYRSSYATDVVGAVGPAAADDDCVDRLMNTVYHAALLLSRVTQAGMAYGDGPAAGTCVIDLATPLEPPGPLEPASGDIVRYPWPGMTLPSGTFRPGSENPRPSPALLPGAMAGTPVLVGLRTADALAAAAEPAGIQIQVFELRDDRDMAVPSVVLADTAISGPAVVADKALHGLFAALVSRQPLPPGRYRVILHATLGQHVVAPAPWEFSVGRRETPGSGNRDDSAIRER
jgi:uncharacterized protein YkwD